MNKVIIYTRVGNDETIEQSSHLEQKKIIEKYAKEHNIKLSGHLSDDATGLTFGRESFEMLLAELELVDTILITHWDRFSTDHDKGVRMLKHLNKRGINVRSVIDPLDMNDPEDFLLISDRIYYASYFNYVEDEPLINL